MCYSCSVEHRIIWLSFRNAFSQPLLIIKNSFYSINLLKKIDSDEFLCDYMHPTLLILSVIITFIRYRSQVEVIECRIPLSIDWSRSLGFSSFAQTFLFWLSIIFLICFMNQCSICKHILLGFYILCYLCA